jgi:Ni,Fe-hydrogenase III large subunit
MSAISRPELLRQASWRYPEPDRDDQQTGSAAASCCQAVGFDLEPERIRVLRERFDKAISDIEEAVGLIWSTPSVMARFEGCGPVTREIAEALGMVGPAARRAALNGIPGDPTPPGRT